MTTTIDPTTVDLATHDSTAATHSARAGLYGARLLAVLEPTVASVADADPSGLGSDRPRGRELLELAATARVTARRLGAEAGTRVTRAAGVVVVRELVAATRVLRCALEATAPR